MLPKSASTETEPFPSRENALHHSSSGAPRRCTQAALHTRVDTGPPGHAQPNMSPAHPFTASFALSQSELGACGGRRRRSPRRERGAAAWTRGAHEAGCSFRGPSPWTRITRLEEPNQSRQVWQVPPSFPLDVTTHTIFPDYPRVRSMTPGCVVFITRLCPRNFTTRELLLRGRLHLLGQGSRLLLVRISPKTHENERIE